ncbi:MAG: ATP-binding protein [Thermodesulfobacteriota bacterium]|nr:ATP-binding protein [Thermodesulfobacteriota bacterium]
MSNTKPQISFSLRNSLSELDRLSEQLRLAGQRWKLFEKTIFQINLVLDELFTNIVNYGFDDTSDHSIVISLEYDGERMQITMTDDGHAFDITQADNPELDISPDQKDVGGLGIFLVRQYVDEISYKRDNGKNIIKLIKIISPGDNS